MTVALLFVFFLGVLVSGPAWMHHALVEDRKRREWAARRRQREMHG